MNDPMTNLDYERARANVLTTLQDLYRQCPESFFTTNLILSKIDPGIRQRDLPRLLEGLVESVQVEDIGTVEIAYRLKKNVE